LFLRWFAFPADKHKEAKHMKGSRLIATVVLLLVALVCFTSTPVFSLDPWDADSRPVNEDPGGSGTDGGGSDDPPGDTDPNTNQGMDQVDGGFDPGWLNGLVFEVTYQIVTYLLGADDQASKSKREVVEESSGNATAQ
jgi:hypothetical protein